MSSDIRFSQEESIGFITLNRTDALNALSLPMIHALQHQLLDWQEDDAIHAVVIQAAPGKAFCAGGDVRWLYETGRKEDPHQMQFFWHEYRLNYFIHQFSKPYIALMDGITMGGGVGISLHGSHPIATERFIFAMPETGIGFFPDIGSSHILSRCPGSFGTYLGLTGQPLRANEAEALGLVKHIIPSENLQSFLHQLMETDLSSNAHARVDACLQPFTTTTTSPLIPEKTIIDDCFSKETMEAILQALEKDGNEWSQEQWTHLKKKCPLSLKITLAQLKKAKTMDMSECIQMDYCLVGHFMRNVDFYEGVRALLVDKDKNPQWNPKHLAEVTDDLVASYFKCGQPALPLMV